ncbi:MAG: gliding motility-associated C-terminal domain-containing protein [Bacteroidetes bacterium]|nr:gliding motility-associated C-terminal domain-containing protein [Bacteroidota bacterium]
MKKLLAVLCFFIYSFSNAQLDTEHWFAPVCSRAGTSALQSVLYLSTNEVTPFTVQVFSDNILISTVTLSQGNRQKADIPGSYMLTSKSVDLFTPNGMGLFVKGSKKFYANYRFSVTNHAEIITSKGLAGLGKKFYAAMAPLTASAAYVNATIGIIATEDNTTVAISGYNPGVVFSNGSSTIPATITLNKGQSYIIDAVSTTANANLNGLIGTKIVADKPISVSNGNYNAIYTIYNSSNNDILMDQSVPTDRLGKDFVLVKGNGPQNSGMEQALVVATENGTTINVNGTNSGITLNEGEYTLIDGINYINQGNGHYNMAINTNKNAYVYQLLAGAATGTVYATGGMNYIPPLSCFLPNSVGEIGYINQIGNDNYNTKLNILTQTGATVTVNGAAIAAVNGPYPVTGNTNWVSYSIPNVTGNITVNSNKSVTAGIAAGSGAVGYGGYFAGFSSVPAITKTGNCYAGVKLQVDNTYDSYQWYLNGVAIPGATTFFIDPELYGSGNYTVMITKNNCDSKLTGIYAYTVCPPMPTVTYNIGSCNSKTITPAFSISTTQTINPAQTQVVGPPTIGTATVNNTTGIITYTPNAGLTNNATDTFVYYIEGNGNPAANQYIKVVVNINVLHVNNAGPLSSCADANGNGIFNLTTASVTTDAGATINYFANANLTNPITTPATYNGPAGTIHAQVTSSYGCTAVVQISLLTQPQPNIHTNTYNGAICDNDLDGVVAVDFSTVTPQIVTNPTQFVIKYYLSQADATAGNNNNLPNNWTYNATTIVYVRVEGLPGNSCPPAFGQIQFSIGTKISLTTNNATTSVCDNDLNNTENINLNDYKNLFTNDPNVTLTFYSTLANAQNAQNPISANQTIGLAGGTYYIRFQNNTECPAIATLVVQMKQPKASLVLVNQTVCNNTNAILDVGAGFDAIVWSTGATTQTISVPPGNYFVDLTFNGCVYRQFVTVTGVAAPTVNTTNFNGAICDDDLDGSVTVNFSTVTPQIVNNPAQFQVRYYLTLANATAGNNITLPNNWSYTTATTVYVRVDGLTGNCPPAIAQLQFSFGAKIQLLTTQATQSVCDANLDNNETVTLTDYKPLFTNNPAVILTFYTTLANAQNGTNPIPAIQNIGLAGAIFYIRFTSPNACPEVAKLTINLVQPKASTTLVDKIICPEKKVDLDAGAGFTSYLWSTGATTQIVNVGVGNYWVDLGFNGCVYRQLVSITAAANPVINKIEINGLSATIHVSGGTPPYLYSLDGINYQNSNVFTGLTRGIHQVFVLSSDRCTPVTKEFLVLNLQNFITPNGDGYNDFLDYSDLRVKKDVSIEIFDRYGKTVYKNQGNNYIWDGKVGGRPLNTGTYWYILKWTDPDTNENQLYNGWILLKNRD